MGRETPVFSKPYPPDSSYERSLGKNDTIRLLQPGEKIRYSNLRFEKDFSYYQVEVDGKSGYIIGDTFMETTED